jgi:anti-sigma regulatory factor (Ser/Thr protein kinase)
MGYGIYCEDRAGLPPPPKSHNLPYFQEPGQESQGGVGFIVHKSLVNKVVKIESVSTRVAYLTVEAMYEDISKTMHK